MRERLKNFKRTATIQKQFGLRNGGHLVTLLVIKLRYVRNVMLKGLRAKFKNNKGLMVKLIETGNAEIHEDSPSDMFWGKKGGDMLEKLLMKVRQEMLELRIKEVSSDRLTFASMMSAIIEACSYTKYYLTESGRITDISIVRKYVSELDVLYECLNKISESKLKEQAETLKENWDILEKIRDNTIDSDDLDRLKLLEDIVCGIASTKHKGGKK